jgi:hypothetical protein
MDDETVSEWTKSLYVVQTYDAGAGNVTTSPASEMKLVVNATPKLKEVAHDPVCKGPVNLTDNKYWNVSNGVKVEEATLDDGIWSYRCPMSRYQTLFVEVEDGTWEILRWETVTHPETPNEDLDVWKEQ